MDWHLKAAAWDLTELEQAAISNITHSFDRSPSFNDHRTTADFCIDLKLGRMGGSSDKSRSGLKQSGVSRMESSHSGSTKRARGASNGAQVTCLVDGCDSDLSTCRDYHRRHKVCELHSKSPEVTIGGHKQRFCQQCSRFHSLEEFDEGKRSCRKRLDGHNRRRRKPPLDPLARPGSILPNYQGTQLLPYSSPHVYPSATAVNATWSAVVSNEEGVQYHNLHQQIRSPEKQSFFLEFSASNYKGGNHFRFLTSDNLTLNNQTSPGASVCQPLLRSIALSQGFEASSGHGIFRESLTTQAANSDCALSLLSSTRTQSSRNQMVQPNSVPLLQSMESTPNYHSLATMDSVLVSDRREAEVHGHGMFDIPSAGSSGNKVTQTLPFSWE